MLPYVWLAVLVWNLLVFALYGWDKRMARVSQPSERRRVPERKLLWMLFLGAPAGAWCGMKLFRHKTRKASFRWRAIALTIVNPLWLLVWLQWSAAATQ